MKMSSPYHYFLTLFMFFSFFASFHINTLLTHQLNKVTKTDCMLTSILFLNSKKNYETPIYLNDPTDPTEFLLLVYYP